MTIFAKAELQKLDPDAARKLMGDATRMVDAGMKAERLELGESTVSVSMVQPPKPPAEMNAEELAEWIAVLEAAKGTK